MLIATSEHMAPLSLARLRRWVHETDFSRHLADDLPVIERSAALRDGRFCSGKTGSKHDLEKKRFSHENRPGQKESRAGQKASSDCGQVETGQRGGENPAAFSRPGFEFAQGHGRGAEAGGHRAITEARPGTAANVR